VKVRMFSDNWNFWTVKYLRQIRHDKALLLTVIALLLVQFMIFRSVFGERGYSHPWPWWLPVMLILCSTGTVLCMAMGFANPTGKKETRPGLSHFIEFAPLDAGVLFRGFLAAFLLTFGIVLLSCLPIWLAGFCYFPDRIPTILAWMGEAFFIALIYGRPDIRCWLRIDLIVEVLFLVGWFQSWFYDLPAAVVLTVFGILAFWQMLGFYDALRPQMQPGGILPRLGQIVLLLAGWWLAVSSFRLDVPVLAVMGGLAGLASMSGALDDIPARQLEGLPKSRLLRLFAFLFYGSSAGGWFWCWATAGAAWWILSCYKEVQFWEFVLTWGLFWAEAAFLLVRRSRRRRTRRSPELIYWVIIPSGLAVSGLMLVLFLISSREASGGQYFHNAGLIGWWGAAVLFLPLLRFIAHDFLLFSRRNGE